MLSRTIILALDVRAVESAGYGRPIAAGTERQKSNGRRAAGFSPQAGLRSASNAMTGYRRVFAGGASLCTRSAASGSPDPQRDAAPIPGPDFLRTHPNGVSFKATCIGAGTPGLWRVRCLCCHEVRSRRPGIGDCYAGSGGRWSTEAVRERTAGDKMADGGLPDLANEDLHGSMTSNARFEYRAPFISTSSRHVRRAATGLRPAMAVAKRAARNRKQCAIAGIGVADPLKQ